MSTTGKWGITHFIEIILHIYEICVILKICNIFQPGNIKKSATDTMTKKAKILIIEEEAIIALEITTELNSWGYDSVFLATNGKQAVSLASEIKPDLILSEIVLVKNIDGIEAVNQIRKEKNIPVIFITTNKYLEDEKQVKQIKPVDVIGKPFKKEDLQQAINKAIG